MKQVKLELKKKLFIVEPLDGFSILHFKKGDNILRFVNFNKANPYDDTVDINSGGQLNLICKGSELTEEIAKELVHQSIHTGLFAHYVKDITVNTYCYNEALESFVSSIQSQGYFWGKNPYGKFFNPEKTLIFEIL